MRMTLKALGAALLVAVIAAPTLAVVEGDHQIPFFTDTDPNYDPNTGRYIHPSTEAGWYYARGGSGNIAVAETVGSATRPQYDGSTNEWRHTHPSIPNYSIKPDSLSSVETENQFPRGVVIFQAKFDGNYSFRGTAQFDWAASGTITTGDISQIRTDFSMMSGAGFGSTDPESVWSSGTVLADHGTFGADQASGTMTVDLGSIGSLQNIPLLAGDFLAIRVGSRGLLGGPIDNATLQYNSVPSDPVRIFGPIPEPASMALLALGGLVVLSRRR